MKKIIISILVALISVGCSYKDNKNIQNEIKKVELHVLNTGNSDCILIKSDKVMLIDAAENDDETFIMKYLKEHNIEKIDYLLSTHPHADHIGGMDAICNNFEIKEMYICEGQNNTKEYDELLDSLKKNDINPIIPKEDETISLGANTTIKFMNCILPDTKDKNDWSIVTELNVGEIKALLMADAQVMTENKLLDKLSKVDILKVGHHGDITSSSVEFINKVNPKYVVVTTGKNDYGHPSDEVLNRYKKINAKIFRTDFDGNVVFEIGIDEIKWNAN